jgi:putative component of toxin-antitoxin plasmid stabilization module
MTDWESPEFFEEMAKEDRDREHIERHRRKSRIMNERMNDMSPVQRQAMALRMAMAPGLTMANL